MKRHFPIIIEQDRDGIYIVNCPSFRGCRSYGNTMEEAIENISDAIEVCLMEESDGSTESLTFVGLRDLELAVS